MTACLALNWVFIVNAHQLYFRSTLGDFDQHLILSSTRWTPRGPYIYQRGSADDVTTGYLPTGLKEIFGNKRREWLVDQRRGEFIPVPQIKSHQGDHDDADEQ